MPTPEYEELESEFGEVMDLLREGLPEVPSQGPSEATWQAIRAEVGPEVGLGDTSPSDGRAPIESASAPTDRGSGATARPIATAPSWGRRVAIGTAVAAAILLFGLPLAVALRGDAADRRADLAALAGFDGGGQAELVGRDLSVRLDGAAAPDGAFYELWIVDWEGEEANEVRSLGPVEVSVDDTIVVPDDIDLERFTGLWVSVEPDDGDPAPSGANILEGRLIDT